VGGYRTAVDLLGSAFISSEALPGCRPLSSGAGVPGDGELSHADAFGAASRARIFMDDSSPAALERADGSWGPAVRRLGSHHASAHATVATLAAAFDEHLSSACRQSRTRVDYWRPGHGGWLLPGLWRARWCTTSCPYCSTRSRR
jgi:hypothetical protein